MPDQRDLRVSDQDREQAAGALSAHYAAGRLDDAELDQRLNAVYAARTESELATLLADLPPLPASELQARAELTARRHRLERRMLQQSGGGLVPFVVCTVVWASAGGGSFWPGFVLLAVLIPLVRNGWLLYGPEPDLDAVEAQLNQDTRRRGRHADRHARIAERRYERRSDRRWPPTA